MAVGIMNGKVINNSLHIEICPNHEGGCKCERKTEERPVSVLGELVLANADGSPKTETAETDELVQPHKVHQFGATRPSEEWNPDQPIARPDGTPLYDLKAWAKLTPDQKWHTNCALEALLLETPAAPQEQAVDHLAGLSI